MSKIRKSAQGQQCQVRIPGVCNFNPETTVLAHLNGGGMGKKRSEIHSSYACSACHDALDGRTKINLDSDKLLLYFHEGVFRTQELLIEQRLLILED